MTDITQVIAVNMAQMSIFWIFVFRILFSSLTMCDLFAFKFYRFFGVKSMRTFVCDGVVSVLGCRGSALGCVALEIPAFAGMTKGEGCQVGEE
jgi:hypothetical protein